MSVLVLLAVVHSSRANLSGEPSPDCLASCSACALLRTQSRRCCSPSLRSRAAAAWPSFPCAAPRLSPSLLVSPRLSSSLLVSPRSFPKARHGTTGPRVHRSRRPSQASLSHPLLCHVGPQRHRLAAWHAPRAKHSPRAWHYETKREPKLAAAAPGSEETRSRTTRRKHPSCAAHLHLEQNRNGAHRPWPVRAP